MNDAINFVWHLSFEDGEAIYIFILSLNKNIVMVNIVISQQEGHVRLHACGHSGFIVQIHVCECVRSIDVNVTVNGRLKWV